jgi:hypothetical protein
MMNMHKKVSVIRNVSSFLAQGFFLRKFFKIIIYLFFSFLGVASKGGQRREGVVEGGGGGGGGLVIIPRLTWRLRIGKRMVNPNPFVKLRGRSPFRVPSHKFWPARNALLASGHVIDRGWG